MAKPFKIVSKTYFSNCLVEALRHKHTKIYYCRPRIADNGHCQNLHLMWSDGAFDYDFSNIDDVEMPWYATFVYRGHIRRFEKGFAEKYCRYRNATGAK